ncbi:NUDIX hydrolase N-terminal domain-containing protein [Cryptosporangium sp. NPDC048952]|uniref:NUDIX hydrolase n=1 Tax=Cryptosporangium sp. NPDC048952 TaxID=3363961 RepID=UPI0037151AB3
MAIELAAMAQNGLNYGTDHYDIDRYTRMRTLSAELMSMITDAEPVDVEAQLALERGHATPKVDVRGALFDDEDRVLLVREARDGRWTLPGGWADALDLPSVAAEREFAEEAGLAVRATKLAAVYDGTAHNGHSAAGPWHIYKLFFVMERTNDAAPVAGLDGETSDVGFFALDALPELSTTRTTSGQLQRMLAQARDQAEPADFD